MGEFTQKRLIRKLDVERFIAELVPQPTPNAQLEQYTISPQVAASMLYLAAYANNDLAGKTVLDLGCGTGRLALGAAFMGAEEVVGVDVDRLAVKVAQENASLAGLEEKVQWVHGDIAAIAGRFDTVLQNPPFGVQTREADRAFLVRALEVGAKVYSLHSHPEVDKRLIGQLKASGDFILVAPSPFLERFIAKNGGEVEAVYAMVMTIGRMFEFHTKAKHDFIIDLYVIKKR